MVKPGITFESLRDESTGLLVESMLDLGLLTGRPEDIINDELYKAYYPHGIGHWLGLDVHDAGLYQKGGEGRVLEPGMAFTIEPGLYIPAKDERAPAEFRGIGVRIEDNLVVNETGCDNLTSTVPKEVDQIEALVGSGVNLPDFY